MHILGTELIKQYQLTDFYTLYLKEYFDQRLELYCLQDSDCILDELQQHCINDVIDDWMYYCKQIGKAFPWET